MTYYLFNLRLIVKFHRKRSKNAMLLNCKHNFSIKSFIELSQKAYKQSGISLIWAIVKIKKWKGQLKKNLKSQLRN